MIISYIPLPSEIFIINISMCVHAYVLYNSECVVLFTFENMSEEVIKCVCVYVYTYIYKYIYT